MKVIKILGTGCKKCNNLEAKVREIIASNNFEAEIEKVTDINKMMDYGIMMTPALVINEEVKSTGIIPNDDQLIKWFNGE